MTKTTQMFQFSHIFQFISPGLNALRSCAGTFLGLLDVVEAEGKSNNVREEEKKHWQVEEDQLAKRNVEIVYEARGESDAWI